MLNTVDENEKVVNNVYTLGGVQENNSKQNSESNR